MNQTVEYQPHNDARRYGWRSQEDFEEVLRDPRYRMFSRSASAARGVPTAELRRPGSYFSKLYLAAREENFEMGMPGSALHRLWSYLNWTYTDSGWFMGDA
jgi:hypothetical protein